jgi:hypothetical protein
MMGLRIAGMIARPFAIAALVCAVGLAGCSSSPPPSSSGGAEYGGLTYGGCGECSDPDPQDCMLSTCEEGSCLQVAASDGWSCTIDGGFGTCAAGVCEPPSPSCVMAGGGGPDSAEYDEYTADMGEPVACWGAWEDCVVSFECELAPAAAPTAEARARAVRNKMVDVEFIYVVIQNETGEEITIQLGKKEGNKFKSAFQTDKIKKDQSTNDKSYKKKIDTTTPADYGSLRAVDKDGNGVEGYTVQNSPPELVRDGNKVGIAVKFIIRKKN